ncbi:response regulator transcription factor [Rathayibacter sp. VKM Ac-2878]|nr:response regulator transcription factor [Rathayibacter sp. VKM Ac-2879]MBF4504293.1 response regulator transcription factor [Rathayibacter sp. VKM Ac-2878]
MLRIDAGVRTRTVEWISRNAPALDVVVSAGSWLELVTSPSFPTQVVVMDFELNEPLSIEGRLRTCRAAGARVLVLSSDDDAVRARSLRAGAAAHLGGDATARDVAEAVLGILPGRPVDPGGWRPPPLAVVPPPRPKLSPSEREALRLYAAGASTPEVAERMSVQFETAKTYLRRIRRKYLALGRPAGRRGELIRRAEEDGFLE